MDFKNTILMFTDGACSGNPGKGGYGTVIVFPDGEVKELGRGSSSTTNNRMEMQAVIDGLKEIRDVELDLWVLTDSTYVIRGITQWIWAWKQRDWTTAEGKDVTNKDLWKELDKEVFRRKSLGKIDWKYVRGHSGTPGNERCDQIAVDFTKGKRVSLFSGSLLNYEFAVHDLPEDMSLPPMKSKSEKKAAFSYLSYVNGKLQRHRTWPECEAVVKGRPGAKFKKSTSAENEVEIVQGWGLSKKDLDSI